MVLIADLSSIVEMQELFAAANVLRGISEDKTLELFLAPLILIRLHNALYNASKSSGFLQKQS